MCCVGPSLAVGLNWSVGGGVGFSDPRITGGRPEGWEEGQGQSCERKDLNFWEEEIKHLLKQVLGTLLRAIC